MNNKYRKYFVDVDGRDIKKENHPRYRMFTWEGFADDGDDAVKKCLSSITNEQRLDALWLTPYTV